MSEIDPDTVLTVYANVACQISKEGLVDGCPETVVELGDKNEYSLKLYTLLAITLQRQGKRPTMLKILDKALTESKILDSENSSCSEDDLIIFSSNYL